MSFLSPLKPFLTAWAMPLSLLLAMTLACVWLARRSDLRPSRRRAALSLASAGLVVLWLVSCNAVAVWLSRHLLPQVSPVTLQSLKEERIQAIVVLGGGAKHDVPEYQGHVLAPQAQARLLYGVHLHRISQLPMAYSGGVGWAESGERVSEAEVAALSLSRLGLPALRWSDRESRDTHQNAQRTLALLQADGVSRIALVTHAWHMPRAAAEFESAGFDRVLPAPMGYITAQEHPILQWIPSADGLRHSHQVWREWLGLQVLRLSGR